MRERCRGKEQGAEVHGSDDVGGTEVEHLGFDQPAHQVGDEIERERGDEEHRGAVPLETAGEQCRDQHDEDHGERKGDTVEDRTLRAEAAPLDQRVGDRDPRHDHRAEKHRQAVGKIATREAATAGADRERHADDEHQVANHIDRRFGHAGVGHVAGASGEVECEQERGRHEHHARVQRRHSVKLPADVRRTDTHDCHDADRGEAPGRTGERDRGERDDGEGDNHP